MEVAKDTFSLDGSQIKLSQTTNRFLISIESANRHFSLELDNDAIPQVSDEIFSDINSMYKGFIDALQKTHKELNLSFDGNGRLTYKISFSAGSITKDHQFSLDLQETEVIPETPWTKIERNMEGRFNQILEKMSALEKRVAITENNNETNRYQSSLEMQKEFSNNLMDMMTQFQDKIFEKLEKLQQKIIMLEQKTSNLERQEDAPSKNSASTSPHGRLCFDRQSPKAVDYIFTNDSQTAERRNSKSSVRELPLSQPLPKTGKFQVSIKIENMEESLWMGMVSAEDLEETDWYRKGIYFQSNGGSIRTSTSTALKTRKPNASNLKTGDILTFKADIDEGVIAFLINNEEINSMEIKLQGKTLIPYLGFSVPQNKFTILN